MTEKKKITQLLFKDELYYYKEHTWVKVEGEQVKVGISDYAQDQLGEIIFIELPAVGDDFTQGDVFGQAESAKTVSSLYMPITGVITQVNEELEDDPEIVNNDPYGAGWLITAEIKDSQELKELLTKDSYIEMLKEKE